MKTRLLIELEIEGASPDDVYDVAEAALDAGAVQEVFEDPERDGAPMKVTGAAVSTLEDDLRNILWPGGDTDAEHGADTLATLANRLTYLRPAASLEGEADTRHEPTAQGLTPEQQRAMVCLRAAAQRFDNNARICPSSAAASGTARMPCFREHDRVTVLPSQSWPDDHRAGVWYVVEVCTPAPGQARDYGIARHAADPAEVYFTEVRLAIAATSGGDQLPHDRLAEFRQLPADAALSQTEPPGVQGSYLLVIDPEGN